MQGLWLYFDEINVPSVPLYSALAVGVVLGVILWVNRRDAWGVKTCVRWMTLLFAIAVLPGLELVPARRTNLGGDQAPAFSGARRERTLLFARARQWIAMLKEVCCKS
jgi:hypothetical protein